MKRLFAPLLLAGALLAGAPAANATTFILTPVVKADGSFTLTFGHEAFAGSGFTDPKEFDDIFEFLLPANLKGKLGGSIVTIANTDNSPTDPSNINFQFVKLNLASFSLSPTGRFEAGSVAAMAATPGTQRLEVHGTSGGNASYAGTINFVPDPVASVPEPAAWALMIMGFGGAGAAIRTRRRGTAVRA